MAFIVIFTKTATVSPSTEVVNFQNKSTLALTFCCANWIITDYKRGCYTSGCYYEQSTCSGTQFRQVGYASSAECAAKLSRPALPLCTMKESRFVKLIKTPAILNTRVIFMHECNRVTCIPPADASKCLSGNKLILFCTKHYQYISTTFLHLTEVEELVY